LFSDAVLGRVDETCKQHEQSNVCEYQVDSTDKPAVDQQQCTTAVDLPEQDLKHAMINTEPSSDLTKENLQGSYYFVVHCVCQTEIGPKYSVRYGTCKEIFPGEFFQLCCIEKWCLL